MTGPTRTERSPATHLKKASLFTGTVLCVSSLLAAPASASLIQFSFFDSQEDGVYNTSPPNNVSIEGQFTLDTGVGAGSPVASNYYDFGAAALTSFSAVVKGPSFADITLGADFSDPNDIHVLQGFGPGPDISGTGGNKLQLALSSTSGNHALTGTNGTFSIVLESRGPDSGGSQSTDFVSNLLYASVQSLLAGLNNPPGDPIDRNNFDTNLPTYGGTGIVLGGLPFGNGFWTLENISVADVTPVVGAVPLPAGGLLLASGAGVFGLMGRRRRRTNLSAAA